MEELSVVVGSDDIGEERGSVWHARWTWVRMHCVPLRTGYFSFSIMQICDQPHYSLSIGLSPHSPPPVTLAPPLVSTSGIHAISGMFSSSPLSSPTSILRAQAVSRLNSKPETANGLPLQPHPWSPWFCFSEEPHLKAASNTHLICENKWNMWK